MPLEIVSRGPESELDRKVAMLAEVLDCAVVDIFVAARDCYTVQDSTVFIASQLGKFLDRLHAAMELASKPG